MPRPKKLDVELRGGKVVAVWFGCIHLPFEEHVVSHDRALEMDSMYEEMNKNIAEGTFQPADLFQKRLEGQAYGYNEDGTVKKPKAAKYSPPSDEITSREA